jgi:hypothetical protein
LSSRNLILSRAMGRPLGLSSDWNSRPIWNDTVCWTCM